MPALTFEMKCPAWDIQSDDDNFGVMLLSCLFGLQLFRCRQAEQAGQKSDGQNKFHGSFPCF